MNYSNAFVGAALIAVGKVVITRNVCFWKALSGPYDGVIVDLMAEQGIDKAEAEKYLPAWADNIEALIDSDPEDRDHVWERPRKLDFGQHIKVMPKQGYLRADSVQRIIAALSAQYPDRPSVSAEQVVEAWADQPDDHMRRIFDEQLKSLVPELKARNVNLMIALVIALGVDSAEDLGMFAAVKRVEQQLYPQHIDAVVKPNKYGNLLSRTVTQICHALNHKYGSETNSGFTQMQIVDAWNNKPDTAMVNLYNSILDADYFEAERLGINPLVLVVSPQHLKIDLGRDIALREAMKEVETLDETLVLEIDED